MFTLSARAFDYDGLEKTLVKMNIFEEPTPHPVVKGSYLAPAMSDLSSSHQRQLHNSGVVLWLQH
jgi:hypothetical protein